MEIGVEQNFRSFEASSQFYDTTMIETSAQIQPFRSSSVLNPTDA